MYQVEFYENSNAESEIFDYIEKLRTQADNNKDSRIQYRQMVFYIELLKKKGTRLPEKITKHLDEGIWELRPGNNRVLYFFFKDNTFVLLHHFRKKTQKTPQKEIDRAKRERADYLSRRRSL